MIARGKVMTNDHVLPSQDKFGSLTKRQTDVLELLSKGKSNKEIALLMGLSENTVKAHLSIVYRVLNVPNRINAVIVSRSFPKHVNNKINL